MNNKGQITGGILILVGIMFALMALFAATALIGPLKDIVDDARALPA